MTSGHQEDLGREHLWPALGSWFIKHPRSQRLLGTKSSRLARSTALSISSLAPFPTLHVFSPLTTHSPIMINDLEPLTSPPTPPPPIPLPPALAGTEAKRSRGRGVGWGWLVGWRTGGVQPGVSYRARRHINQPDVFTQACLLKPGYSSQRQGF